MACFGLLVCFFVAGMFVGATATLEWIAVRIVRWLLIKRVQTHNLKG
jgi:hypothetical protein